MSSQTASEPCTARPHRSAPGPAGSCHPEKVFKPRVPEDKHAWDVTETEPSALPWLLVPLCKTITALGRACRQQAGAWLDEAECRTQSSYSPLKPSLCSQFLPTFVPPILWDTARTAETLSA